MMTALEQLGSAIASSATPSAAARDLVELHLIDTVGAWIAGARTTEGLGAAALPRRDGRGAHPPATHWRSTSRPGARSHA